MKKKKHISSLKSELHYISPLPMEVLAKRLRDLEQKNRPLRIRQLSEDEIGFVWQNRVRGQYVNTELFGSLMRWNGTFCRLDIDSKVSGVGGWIDVLVQVVAVISLIVAMTPCFALFSFFSVQADMTLIFLFGFIGLGFATFLALALLRFSRIDLFSGLRFRAMRDTDSMMQAIADKLSEWQADDETLLEFDGSELSLATLLQSEKYKQFRVSEDGEIE